MNFTNSVVFLHCFLCVKFCAVLFSRFSEFSSLPRLDKSPKLQLNKRTTLTDNFVQWTSRMRWVDTNLTRSNWLCYYFAGYILKKKPMFFFQKSRATKIHRILLKHILIGSSIFLHIQKTQGLYHLPICPLHERAHGIHGITITKPTSATRGAKCIWVS